MDAEQSSLLARGRECILTEAEALQATARQLDATFVEVLHMLRQVLDGGRKVIFSGVGKSADSKTRLVTTLSMVTAEAMTPQPV